MNKRKLIKVTGAFSWSYTQDDSGERFTGKSFTEAWQWIAKLIFNAGFVPPFIVDYKEEEIKEEAT